MHRDLKPSNILLHDGVLKVADFGFCKTLLGPQDLTKTMVGSPIYMAPEILKGKLIKLIYKGKTTTSKRIFGRWGSAFLRCSLGIVRMKTKQLPD